MCDVDAEHEGSVFDGRGGFGVDRALSAGRIEETIEVLSRSAYTASSTAICRYAYSEPYQRTVEYLAGECRALGFAVQFDAIGTLVARNVEPGEPALAIGSHCDSNRNGGKYDGTLGMAVALEVCRLNVELDLGLPLQIMAFLEEEGSGFGQMLLGSRVMSGGVTNAEMAGWRSLDDGRPFIDCARAAGYNPERWRESRHHLDGLIAWVEPHIEQGRVLQDSGHRVGVVTAIAGRIDGSLRFLGRQDHAGATPMLARLDAAIPAARCIVELERLGRASPVGSVATVGGVDVRPGLVNVVPGEATLRFEVRGPDDDDCRGIWNSIVAFAETLCRDSGFEVQSEENLWVRATQLDSYVVGALDHGVESTGVRVLHMVSGALHDTAPIAACVPAGMLFLPCRDGVSHSPLEEASPADAAFATEVLLQSLHRLFRDSARREKVKS